VPAGPSGGAYRPLSDADVERIHRAVLDVLETVGMADPIPILRQCALEQGCRIDARGRLRFPRALVEDVIARAGRDLFFCGRDPRHDLDLSRTRVYTYGGGEAVTTLDVGANAYRPSTLKDVYDFARLVDRPEHIQGFARLVVATEIDDLRVCDINTAYASVAGTLKHVALTFADASHVAPTLELLHMIAGGEQRFSERPFCHGGGCPVISPLRYGRHNSEVCIESMKFGAPVWTVVAPQAGATAPAALAGSLVQVTAEALASLLLVDLVSPGYPVILGPWPFVSDLRTGGFSGGGAEEALLNAAAAQIINHYGLTSSVSAGMTDSKLPDNQAGYEKGLTVALAALAGANNVSESAGMTASLMGCSFEALVIDDDMLGQVLRTVRGIEVSDETLSVDVIREVVDGEGHYLRHPQTLDLMRSEYAYPKLADRSAPDDWEKAGMLDIRARAAERARSLLDSHYPEYIDSATDARIRERFPIRLAPEHMRPQGGSA
jgi:trimethylamine--corrinoid protein Co-methyltransferase